MGIVAHSDNGARASPRIAGTPPLAEELSPAAAYHIRCSPVKRKIHDRGGSSSRKRNASTFRACPEIQTRALLKKGGASSHLQKGMFARKPHQKINR